MKNRRHLVASCCVMTLCIGGCDTGAVITVSDVPCFQPTAWTEGSGRILVRAVPTSVGTILITFQSSKQIAEDRANTSLAFSPHDPVYRFSPDTGTIDLVDDAQWDNLTEPPSNCLAPGGDESPFEFSGGPRLRFEGEQISVTGGATARLEGAPFSAVVAVLSTDGSVRQGVPFISFTLVEPSGQHFHQLFSRVDGSPIGEAVRLGVVGRADQCWTRDEKYVIYSGVNPNKELIICIVPIEDELPQFGN